jgi:hypothetical protein
MKRELKQPNAPRDYLREKLAVLREPDFGIDIWLHAVAQTGNPYYAWKAIQVCITHKKEFPNWLTVYLAQCAQRMMSDKAKETGDLRANLPWIFGFPNLLDPTQRKHGPGNLLNPDHAPGWEDKQIFAVTFFGRLVNGEDPLMAMHNACNDVFHGENANADEKTLRRWLLKEFHLKEWPSSADHWKAVAREHYRSIFSLLGIDSEKVSRDSAVTPARDS